MSGSRSGRMLFCLTLTGLFAALSFVALFFKIPIAGQFVHVGNAVTLLAALLLGGVYGGLSGSIGMGLFDLIYYPSSLPTTLVLKFGIGLFTGLIFRYGRRHPERSAHTGLAVACALFLLGGALSLWGYLARPDAAAALLASVFMLVVGTALAVVLCVSWRTKKLSRTVLWAILGCTVGIAWNVSGEFLWKVVSNLLLGMEFSAAVTQTLLAIPATFINGSFSIFVAVLLYVPLQAALRKAHLDIQ